MFRKRVSKRRSRRMFTKTARKVSYKNFKKPMRGGIRF